MSGRVFTLLNVWSEQNKGDFAIVVSTIQYLKDKFKVTDNDKINIVFIGLTREAVERLIREKQIDELKSYRLVPAPVPFLTQENGKLLGLPVYKKLLNLGFAHLRLILRKGEIFDVIKESDILISVGGHYLFSFHPDNVVKEFLSLYALTYPYKVAEKLGKVVNLFGVSIGPFYHDISWKYLRRVLKPHKIFAREKYTYDLVTQKLGLNAKLIPDVAFYLQLDKPSYKPVKDTIKIGMTIRDWPFPEVDKELRDQKKVEYKQAVVEFCKNAVKKYKKIKITFYPQVCIPSEMEDDRHIMAEIRSMLDKDTLKHVEFWMHQPKLDELVKAYHNMHVMIGTRMHSLILGIPVPFIGIAYMGKKTHGLIKWLGYPEDLIVDISKVTAEALLGKLDMVLKERRVLFGKLQAKKEEFRKLIFNAELE